MRRFLDSLRSLEMTRFWKMMTCCLKPITKSENKGVASIQLAASNSHRTVAINGSSQVLIKIIITSPRRDEVIFGASDLTRLRFHPSGMKTKVRLGPALAGNSPPDCCN